MPQARHAGSFGADLQSTAPCILLCASLNFQCAELLDVPRRTGSVLGCVWRHHAETSLWEHDVAGIPENEPGDSGAARQGTGFDHRSITFGSQVWGQPSLWSRRFKTPSGERTCTWVGNPPPPATTIACSPRGRLLCHSAASWCRGRPLARNSLQNQPGHVACSVPPPRYACRGAPVCRAHASVP